MDGGKKIIAIVVLLAIIAAVVVFGIKKSNIGGPKPPQWVLDQEVEKIDAESLELVTRTLGEWQKLGSKDGKYKNPDTGKYTMVSRMDCAACGAKIPMPEFPMFETAPGDVEPGSMDMEKRARSMEEEARIMSEYICPVCGERAFPAGGMGPPMIHP